MSFTLPQPRPKHRPALGAMPLLVALLLAMLQVATPFAHAMLHATGASQGAIAGPAHQYSAAWSSTSPEEKPCALCAADHLPALPKTPAVTATLATARVPSLPLPTSMRSSAPLDLFCRPPPVA